MAEIANFARCEIRRTPHHVACDVGEEKVILQTKSGEYLGLNPVGAFLWDLLAQPRRGSDLIESLLECYEVDRTTAQSDLAAFINELAGAGAIEVR